MSTGGPSDSGGSSSGFDHKPPPPRPPKGGFPKAVPAISKHDRRKAHIRQELARYRQKAGRQPMRFRIGTPTSSEEALPPVVPQDGGTSGDVPPFGRNQTRPATPSSTDSELGQPSRKFRAADTKRSRSPAGTTTDSEAGQLGRNCRQDGSPSSSVVRR